MQRFDGKTVLITGGAGSIGWAAAQRFSAEGAAIVLADRDAARAAELAATLPKAISLGGDLSLEADVDAVVQAAEAAFGGIDVLFNNAGISGPLLPVHELDPAAWDQVIATNLRSIFLVLRATTRAMIAAGRPGAVVNMGSSLAGWDVLARSPGYLASKYAVVGLTKSAALDLAGYQIRVNAVCPGVIETSLGVPAADHASYLASLQRFSDRIPLRRLGQPADVAGVVAFLASEDARHITGVDYLIDGGQTLASWANAPQAEHYPMHDPKAAAPKAAD